MVDLFLMAPGAFPGGKRLGPVMTDTAGFSAQHIRHHHFCFALFHGKRGGMAGGAGKPSMAFVMEVHVFPGRLIFQGIGPAGFGGRLILMAAVAVVKGRSVLFGMAGKTRLPVPVIVKINFCGPFPVGKRPGMTDLASAFQLVAGMRERDGFCPLAEMDGFPGSGNGFPMAAAAIPPGKGVFVPAAVAAKTKPAAAVVRHADPGGSFAGLERGRMTAPTGRFFQVNVMVERHALFAFSQSNGIFKRRRIFGRRHNAGSEVAARTLRVRGKSFFAVVTGAAVFPLVQGLHVVIFVFLDVEGLHFEQAGVTDDARASLPRVVLMAEDDRFQRPGVKNAGDFLIRRRGSSATDQKQSQWKKETFSHADAAYPFV